MARPLEGLMVVALEHAVAAPFCTCRLADAGARVVKVERPEGDFARRYDKLAGGESAYFVWLNRGKESVALDLRQEHDLALLQAMLRRADVLVQNLKPGALRKLGLAPERLRAANPALIVCSITGYGETGPYASRKAYDLLIQAESGLASITGGPEAPARVGISVVDIATGHNAYEAVLEALVARSKTGAGIEIGISMFDVIADWLAVPLLQYEGGSPPRRAGLSHPSIAPYGVFQSADGDQILIAIQNDREWQLLCRDVLGRPELGEDPRFATNIARSAERSATDTLVAETFRRYGTSELVARLEAADIAFASVSDMARLATHPHLRRIAVETASGVVAYPAPPQPREAYGAVPALGADTERVRAEFAGSAAQAE